MAQPSRNHQDFIHASSSVHDNGNSLSTDALMHDPGISLEWTADEQAILEEGLLEFASESIMNQYANIAVRLKRKTVRDVALRSRWMTENSKRRKEELNLTKASKDKKERVTDVSAKSSHLAFQPNSSSHELPKNPMYKDDVVSYRAIGGTTRELLEQNAQVLSQITTNLENFQIHENVNLFCKACDNIRKLENEMHNMPDVMKQMPPLPVQLNEQLANTILPCTFAPMHS